KYSLHPRHLHSFPTRRSSDLFVITQHCTREGEAKLVQECTFPLTGCAVVNRIYTDLAVIEVTPNGFRLVELSPGIDFDFVQERTDRKSTRLNSSHLGISYAVF